MMRIIRGCRFATSTRLQLCRFKPLDRMVGSKSLSETKAHDHVIP